VFVPIAGVEVRKRQHKQHYATRCSNMSLSMTGLQTCSDPQWEYRRSGTEICVWCSDTS